MPVLRSVVVKTHSKFLVRGMTEEVIRWRQNGWINCNGVKTCNWQYYAEIDDRIEDLRRRGVNVAFWLVEKEQNEEARALAIDAIERVGMSLWNGVQRVKNCECD